MYGSGWMQGDKMVHDDDLVAALGPVASVFDSLGIRYFIGGSVATSFHGASRSTMDVDVVAELNATDIEPLLEALGDKYYTSAAAAIEAVNRTSCFNLIHLATSFKVDVFVSRKRPFDIDSMSRAKPGTFGNGDGITVPVASAEDAIVAKLEWYRLTDETSEKQWLDVTRVLDLLGEKADWDYMEAAANSTGVEDLLQRLRKSLD